MHALQSPAASFCQPFDQLKTSSHHFEWPFMGWTIKYLGHVLTCDLRDSGDIRRVKRQLYYSVNVLCAKVGQTNRDILVNCSSRTAQTCMVVRFGMCPESRRHFVSCVLHIIPVLTRAPLGYSAERAPLGGGRFCPPPCLTPELIGAARRARRRSKALNKKIPMHIKNFL